MVPSSKPVAFNEPEAKVERERLWGSEDPSRGLREKEVLRPWWELTLVERPSVSSQSVRASREGLGLLETPKQAKIQGMRQLRESPTCLRSPRGLEWSRLLRGLSSNLQGPEPIASERCSNRGAERRPGAGWTGTARSPAW